MHKTGYVVYVDGLGKPHDALVRAINGMHPNFLTLSYVDEKADDRDNLITVFDVSHKDDESRADVREVRANGPSAMGTTVQDGNPNLPHYDVNVWMEHDEDHNALPSDHPAFDPPFAVPEFDQSGNRIPVVRTEYEREIAEHMARQGGNQSPPPQAEDYTPSSEGEPSAADLDAVAAEEAAKAATAPSIQTEGVSSSALVIPINSPPAE